MPSDTAWHAGREYTNTEFAVRRGHPQRGEGYGSVTVR